jgi:exosortase A
VIAYWETTSSLVQTWWHSQTYAHGFIILPISLYLAWRKRDDLQRIIPTPSWPAVVLIGPGTLLWIGGYASNALAIQQLGLILVLQALVPVLLGRRVANVLLFPLAYLLFAWPAGEALIPILQDVTAWIVVNGLQLTGIPVAQEGRFILIPNGTFEVAEACSGVRYLMAAFSLGTLYAYLSYRSTLKRITFSALSFAVPIVANGIRAYGIVIIAYLTDMRWAVGVDHLIYGWLFFGVVMLILFSLGYLWQDPAGEGREQSRQIDAVAFHHGGSRAWPVMGIALLIATTGPLYARVAKSLPNPEGSSRAELPTLPGWLEMTSDEHDWSPTFIGADSELRMMSGADGERVHLYVAKYIRQRQGAEMINSENRLYDPARWKRISEQSVVWSPPGSSPEKAHEIVLHGSAGRLIVWYWYEVGDEIIANPIWVKIRESTAALLRTRESSCVIALTSKWNQEESHPRRRLEQKASELYERGGSVCQQSP